MKEYDILPDGEYVAKICKSEKQTSKQNPEDRYINLEFEINDGEFKGHRFWTKLNLWNSNARSVAIAQQELNSICHATGKPEMQDTEKLHNILMKVKVVQRYDKDYGKQSIVKSYSSITYDTMITSANPDKLANNMLLNRQPISMPNSQIVIEQENLR